MIEVGWFSQEVAASGYAWARGEAGSLFLVPVIPHDRTYSYNPLTEPLALYRILADTPPTPEGVLAFAKRYGMLGADTQQQVSVGQDLLPGEPLTAWVGEIRAIREYAALWQQVATKDEEALSRVIRWWDDGVKYDNFAHLVDRGEPIQAAAGPLRREEWIASPRHRRERLEPVHKGAVMDASYPEWYAKRDVVAAAWFALQDGVNQHVQGRVSFGLLNWATEVEGDDCLMPGCSADSLIGALWLRFALAIGEGRFPQRCSECTNWFEPAPAGGRRGRADRQVCSGTCRARRYQKRIAQARDLDKQGVPAAEIAQRLDADVRTVKGWIGSWTKGWIADQPVNTSTSQ
jgi:hypothetical protein